MTLNIIVFFDTTAAFVIPLVTLLTPTPVMWHEEHVWYFKVLQRVHLSNFADAAAAAVVILFCFIRTS
jgi:hypothetical protein